MALTIITGPATEPVTLAEAKTYLRIDGNDADSLITGLIAASRQVLEQHTNLAFINQTLRQTFNGGAEVLRLSRKPVSAISSVVVYRVDQSSYEIPSIEYIHDGNTLRYLYWVESGTRCWPSGRGYSALEVNYTAGFGADATFVPEVLKVAIKQMVAFLYENPGDLPASLPPQVAALVSGYVNPLTL